MKNNFCTYNQSLALKELGYNQPGLMVYGEGILIHPLQILGNKEVINAPLIQQAFHFFREKYGLDSAVLKDRYVIETDKSLPNWYCGFTTYEEAQQACLSKLIKLAKGE